MIYIRIDRDIITRLEPHGFIARFLHRLIPARERELQNRSLSAHHWWIQVDDRSAVAQREISFDASSNPVVVGPVPGYFRGLWVDSFASFGDLDKFTHVPEGEFVPVWNQFLSTTSVDSHSEGAA